jgi:hypothetical protein
MMRRLAAAFAILFVASAAAATEPVLDIAALPKLQGGGARVYAEHFLRGNLPRVFAIATNGAYGAVWGGRSMETNKAEALAHCARRGGTDCRFYAIDLDVVWRNPNPPARLQPPPLAVAPGFEVVPDIRFLPLGPGAATGLFVWGHGFNGSDQDVRGIQPPPFLRAFNNAGWDIARFDREPSYDANVERASAFLRAALEQARQTGYRRIGVGGQSRGGWNALEMLLYPGTVDVIITHSAGPGTGTLPGLQATKGQTMLWRLTDDIPPQATLLAYAQFADDPYGGDKTQRAARLRATLPGKIGGLLLIDQPEGLKGHGAGASNAYAERYATCLLAFAETGANSCK